MDILLIVAELKKGFHCFSSGGHVRRLTKTRQMSDAASAGKIIGMFSAHPPRVSSRVDADPTSGAKAARNLQAIDIKVPARIEASPPALVARFQKKVARTAGAINIVGVNCSFQY